MRVQPILTAALFLFAGFHGSSASAFAVFPFGLVAGWAWMRRNPGFNG